MAIGDGQKRTADALDSSSWSRPAKKNDISLTKVKAAVKVRQLRFACGSGSGTRSKPVQVLTPVRGASVMNTRTSSATPTGIAPLLRIGVTQTAGTAGTPSTPSKSHSSTVPASPRTPVSAQRGARATALSVRSSENLATPIRFGKDVNFKFDYLSADIFARCQEAASKKISTSPSNASWLTSGVDNDVLPSPPDVRARPLNKDGSTSVPGKVASAGRNALVGAVNAGRKAVKRAFDTAHHMLGFLSGRREQALLEVTRLDALPQEGQRCSVCVNVLKRPGPHPAVNGCETQSEYAVAQEAADTSSPAPTNSADAASIDKEQKVAGLAQYRCQECRFAVMCRECVADAHRLTPFHRLESAENGRFWDKVANKADLGIEVQLMHDVGERCYLRATVDKFTVVDVNGTHTMRVHFCECGLGVHVDRYSQLMRSRLWPATPDRPKMATTFEALDQFSRLSLLGRLTAYDYHKALAAATDAMGVLGLPSVYKNFMSSAHQYMHVFMFKRAGRAYEEGGIDKTPAGGAAVQCIACPRAGVNIPSDYLTRPFRWLYRMVVAIDANFRLSNKINKSTDETDPCLTDGKAYVVNSEDLSVYVKHMEKKTNKDTVSDCSRFGAVNMQNQKGARYGMRSTGVGGAFCARHDTILPLGIAQLSYGERYSVMDFVVCCASLYISVPDVIYSYDIACQWSRNLVTRLEDVSPTFKNLYDGACAVLKKTRDYLVPKFHLYAHKVECWLRYNFSFTPGAGQTDGEGCERVWAGANPAAASLREMGPGSMRDALDAMCCSWNNEKNCGACNLTCERMKAALPEAENQIGQFKALDEAVKMDAPALHSHWSQRMVDWEDAGQKGSDCPYESKKASLSLPQLNRAAKKGTKEVSAAKDVSVGEDASPWVGSGEVLDSETEKAALEWLMLGLRIEERRLRLSSGLPDEDACEISSDAENALWKMLTQFRKHQERFMPETYQQLTPEERHPRQRDVHKLLLFMPSAIVERGAAVRPAIRDLEARLRMANMETALENAKGGLKMRVMYNKHKIANVTGQHANTQARSSQEMTEKRITAARESYNRHRAAYKAIVGPGRPKEAEEKKGEEKEKEKGAGGKKGGKDEKGAGKESGGVEKNGVAEEGDNWEEDWPEMKREDCVGLGQTTIAALEKLSESDRNQWLRDRAAHKKSSVKVKVPDASGHTHTQVSWLWYKTPELGDGLEVTHDLMVEWCRQRARAQRCAEQVMLLRAEFERIIETDVWEANEWEKRAEKWKAIPVEEFTVRRVAPASLVEPPSEPRDKTKFSLEMLLSAETCDEFDGDGVLKAGLVAYAYKQADYRRRRAERNRALWDARRNDVDGFLSRHTPDGIRK